MKKTRKIRKMMWSTISGRGGQARPVEPEETRAGERKECRSRRDQIFTSLRSNSTNRCHNSNYSSSNSNNNHNRNCEEWHRLHQRCRSRGVAMGDDSGRLLADRDTKGKGKPFKTGNGSTPRRVSDQGSFTRNGTWRSRIHGQSTLEMTPWIRNRAG